MKSVQEILTLAENFEIEGFRFYKDKKDQVNLKLAKEVFEYLMNMEKEHTEFIRRLKKDILEGNNMGEISLPKQKSIFEERVKDYKLEEGDKESDLSDLSILRVAYLIEKDFVNFYSNSAEKVEDEKLKQILLILKKWEEGHAEMIKGLIEKIFERNNLDLGFYPF